MSYNPLAPQIFNAAFTGAIAGIAVNLASITDSASGDYANPAAVAGAFAISIDQAWGSVRSVSLLDVYTVQETASQFWTNRSPTPIVSSLEQSASWTVSASAIIAVTTAAEGYFTAQGISPLPVPGAGSVTWSNDLVGSTSTDQWVASISGESGLGGNVPVNANLVVNGTLVLPDITAHATLVSEGGSSAVIGIGPGVLGTPYISGGSLADPSFSALNLGLATAITGTLGVANGGTGVANPTAHYVAIAQGTSAFNFVSPSTAGYVLTSNGPGSDPTFQSNDAAVTWANDLNGSTSANQYINSISGHAGGGGNVAVTAASFTYGAAVATPTWTQTAQTSDVAVNDMTFTTQAPYASASTHIAGGNFNVNIPLPVGSEATNGYFRIQVGGTNYVQAGNVPLGPFGAIFLGSITPNATNYSLIGDGTSVLLNAPSAGGAITLSVGASSKAIVTTSLWETVVENEINFVQTGSTIGTSTPHLLFNNNNPAGETIIEFAYGSNAISGFRADASGNINYHAASGESHNFYDSVDTSAPLAILNSTNLTLYESILFPIALSAPTISQASNTITTAQTLTIQAQDALGAGSTGGELLLAAGTGVLAGGAVVVQTGTGTTAGAFTVKIGSTTEVNVTPSLVTISEGLAISGITAHYVLIGEAGSAIVGVSPTANNGYVLTSNGVGGDPSFQAIPTQVTFADDLAGSTSSAQYIAAISGNGGAGGTVGLNITTLQFASSQATPALSQAAVTTTAATGQTLTIGAQNATGGGATVGGTLNLTSGSGATNGNVNIQVGGTTQLQVTPSAVNIVLTETVLNSSGTNPVLSTVTATATANGTPTVGYSVAMAASSLSRFVVNVTGVDTGGAGDAYSADFEFIVQRAGSAAASLNPTTPVAYNVLTNGSGISMGASVALSTNTLQVSVAGLASTAIHWTTTVTQSVVA